MASFEDIVRTASIEVVENSNTVSLVEDKLPEIDSIESFEEFVSACELLDLPVIHNEMLDVEYYYRNILVYLVNISPEIGVDVDKIIQKNKEVDEFLSLEEKADALEIKLASLKDSYEISRVEKSEIVQEVGVLEKVKDLDKEALLAILKGDRKIQRMLKKDELLKRIYGAENSVLKNVFIKFIEHDFVDIRSVEEAGIDRITALKIVYQLSLKDIVTYDQINDLISLNK